MEFWWGLTVGCFAGANIGIVMAGLLGGSKRKEINRDYLWDHDRNSNFAVRLPEGPKRFKQPRA
jgi:hypothetical protein